MKIIGISAYYHDSAAALIDNGKIVCAAQEERFTRIKHDASFPRNAIEFCLDYSGTTPADVDAVVFYEKPLLTFERLLETYLAFTPRGRRGRCCRCRIGILAQHVSFAPAPGWFARQDARNAVRSLLR
jgi:carbamoyltransferase